MFEAGSMAEFSEIQRRRNGCPSGQQFSVGRPFFWFVFFGASKEDEQSLLRTVLFPSHRPFSGSFNVLPLCIPPILPAEERWSQRRAFPTSPVRLRRQTRASSNPPGIPETRSFLPQTSGIPGSASSPVPGQVTYGRETVR